ncbi:MAG: hypothetical protein AB7S26_14895 [Sandaracinaceae bacterium]
MQRALCSFAVGLLLIACEPSDSSPDDAAADPRDAGVPIGDAGSTSDGGPADAGAAGDGAAGDGGGADAGSSVLPGVLTIAPLPVEPVPTGRVTMAIGTGNGRIVTVCDDGARVVQDLIVDPTADDHSEYAAAPGAAFGNDVFVVATGHGQPGHILRSTDGRAWDDLADDAFHWADGSTGRPGGGIALVYFDGARFVMIASRHVFFSDDGAEWTDQGVEHPRGYFHWRNDFFADPLHRLFVRGENVDTTVQWLSRSDDDGVTLAPITEADGWTFECAVGGAVFAHGVLLAPGSASQYCMSLDGGVTWSTVPVEMGVELGGFHATDTGFVSFRGQRRFLQRSTDAMTWTQETIDNGYRHATGGRAPQGYYLNASHAGTELWRSDDSVAWTPLDYPRDTTIPALKHFAFGHADASACDP